MSDGGGDDLAADVRTALSALPPARIVGAIGGYRVFGRREITRHLAAAGMVDIRQTITGQGQYVVATAPSRRS